jgi:hypothetical protein
MININKTLSYYLTENAYGWLDFKKWINNTNFEEPIEFKINLLIIKVEKSDWLEIERRHKIFQEIRDLLSLYVKNLCYKEPIEYFQEYITELNKYCYQGGYGYSVVYTNSPHHWMIKIENYEKVEKLNTKFNLENIKLCSIICNLCLSIDTKPTWAQWCN